MNFELHILPLAQRDLEETLQYLSDKSEEAAERWYRDWLSCCHTLRQSASNFAVAPENTLAEFTVQQFIFRSGRRRYRVLYRILDDTVYVYHIRGPGQDWVKALSKNLPNQ